MFILLHKQSIICYFLFLFKVAFSYGFGVSNWQKIPYNVIPVPNALYAPEEDNSQ